MPITAKTPVVDIIKDFEQSSAPQFKGKTKKKIIDMAIAAHMAKVNEDILKETREGGRYNSYGNWKSPKIVDGKKVSNIDDLIKQKSFQKALGQINRAFGDKKKEEPVKDILPENPVDEAYSKSSVDKSIKSSKQKIGGKEARLIHALLKGRQKTDEPIKESADDFKAGGMPYTDAFGGRTSPPVATDIAAYTKNVDPTPEFSPLLNFLKAHKIDIQEPNTSDPKVAADMFNAASTPVYDRAAHRQGNDQEQTKAAWDAINPDNDEWEMQARIQKAREKAYISMHGLWQGERN